MAKPKINTRRPKSVLDQDRYTAELSTGQLVIGVCILLMFGLGCFLLGVLIGKFDPTLNTDVVAEASSSDPDAPTTEVSVTDLSPASSPDEITQPRQSALPPEMRVPPRILEQESAPPQDTPPPQSSVVESSAAESTTAPAVEPLALPEPTPATTAQSEPAGVSQSVQAAAEKNRIAPPSASPQVITNAGTKSPSAADQPAVVSTPAEPDWKGFGVQVIAVSHQRAEGALRKVQGSTSHGAKIMSAGNALSRVVVGPFTSQQAAMKARDELRRNFDYRTAFVVTLD